MAVSLKHTTQAVGPDAGNGEIRLAQWNEEHTLTLASGKLIGRTSAGTGAAEEISLLDEDDMASDSATAVPTQQSVKAYVDTSVAAVSYTPRASTVTVITSSQTYTPPAGCLWVKFKIQGCGGSGSSGNTASNPVGLAGGACGSYAEKTVAASTISSGVSVTIGAGGSGVATSLGAPLSITVPGASGASAPAAPSGSVDFAIEGANGSSSGASDNSHAKGADSMIGFGGRGAGESGTGYGSGGSSGQNSSNSTSRSGASGAPGVVIAEEYYG